MTKQEAIAAMAEGKKVTHAYFSAGEWMRECPDIGGMLEFEDGVGCPSHEFWKMRKAATWQSRWSVYHADK